MIQTNAFFKKVVFFTPIFALTAYSKALITVHKLYFAEYLPIIAFFLFFDTSRFYDRNNPIQPESFNYLLEHDESYLFENYRKFKRNRTPTKYHTLVHLHSNGISKKLLNFKDVLKIETINIKHFHQFLNHGDKHEFEKTKLLLRTLNSPSSANSHQFTLIYGLVVSRPSSHLLREIEALFTDDIAFIIFYDNKSNRTALYDLLQSRATSKEFKKVYIIDSPRFFVDWGRITLSFAEIVLIQASLKFFPKSLYCSIHSESDYPIVPARLITKFFRDNYPKNYIETLQTVPTKKHVRKKHFELYFNYTYSAEVFQIARRLFPKRGLPNINWQHGWNWFTMTLKDCKRMIDTLYNKFEIVDVLEYAIISDEMLFQTLVAEGNIKSVNNDLRYIDWKFDTPNPPVLNESYYNEIINQKCSLWARKFSLGESDKVLDMIDKYIQNYPKREYICS